MKYFGESKQISTKRHKFNDNERNEYALQTRNFVYLKVAFHIIGIQACKFTKLGNGN